MGLGGGVWGKAEAVLADLLADLLADPEADPEAVLAVGEADLLADLLADPEADFDLADFEADLLADPEADFDLAEVLLHLGCLLQYLEPDFAFKVHFLPSFL